MDSNTKKTDLGSSQVDERMYNISLSNLCTWGGPELMEKSKEELVNMIGSLQKLGPRQVDWSKFNETGQIVLDLGQIPSRQNELKVHGASMPWWNDPKMLPPGAPGSYWELGAEESNE